MRGEWSPATAVRPLRWRGLRGLGSAELDIDQWSPDEICVCGGMEQRNALGTIFFICRRSAALLLSAPDLLEEVRRLPVVQQPGHSVAGAIHGLQLPASQKDHAWSQTALTSDPVPDLRWVHRIERPG
jgi:hypothetical protein